MKFGICGYGNLGRAVERTLLKNNEEIVGIFSRRQNLKSEFGTPIFDFEDAKNFCGQIDVMFMCGGSQQDLLWQSPLMCRYFNIVDTFDTHAKIPMHKQKLDEIAKSSGHVAIFSCGWDPGVFSLIRSLARSVFGKDAHTFWGEGVSQGHSEALRNICGVKDAVQFTVPNKELCQKVKNDPNLSVRAQDMHERHCFICLDGTRSFADIERQIMQTEDYFKGQKVFVKECSQEELNRLKQKISHKGEVLAGDENSSMNFSVSMESNPDFTAKIAYAYSSAVKRLESGAYNVLEIPVKFLEKQNELQKQL